MSPAELAAPRRALEDEELRQLLRSLAAGEQEAAREQLEACGVAGLRVLEWVRSWSATEDVLPSGQWIPRQLIRQVLAEPGLCAAERQAPAEQPEEEPDEQPWEAQLHAAAAAIPRHFSTRRFPNRRQPERLGELRGRRRRRRAPVVLVVLDTTATLAPGEQVRLQRALRRLARSEARIALAQCDQQVLAAGWFGADAALERLAGCGSSDLRPPFTRPLRERFQPDLVVYVTDGYGRAPLAAPAGFKVLWLLSGPAPRIPARYGRSVPMRPSAQRQAKVGTGD